ncbi:pentapeptide repeat-containing protein [Oscillatoria sp. CS-180]|uniref:pentapeptide repeat-containing protein n=1 Tax=Oscillatoria sp. CS-180 TaxID=3021720 RepID=UPI00232D3BA8|nr:pentapeptide repeat-containing protein [Oscillatoria sp. CS-180]MDB9529951.1 pentapeptide repeat-containing protein [Oscillatoria sp. CS-180]
MNGLPSAQFEELCFALNPPKGILPSNTAPQGERTKALLDWAEGPTGPGLVSIDQGLEIFVPKITQPEQSPIPKAFAVSGKMGDLSPAELAAIVQLLRQKTGDGSIELAFFTEGSIKLVLNGTPEGLDKLQELFDSAELTEVLDNRPVEYVRSIESSSTEARKARLLQVLRVYAEKRKLDIVRARELARELARDLNLDLVQAQTPNRARDLNLDLARTLALALVLALARNLALARTLARDLNLALVRYRELNRDLDLDLAMNLVHARYLALARVLSLFVDIDFGYADLSGANLRRLDLRGVILEGADLSDADVTGTLFGDNPGLTEASKRDLQQRGAIFQEPPSSDVPSLVLR